MIKKLSLAFLVLMINTALNAQDINIIERNNGLDIEISEESQIALFCTKIAIVLTPQI